MPPLIPALPAPLPRAAGLAAAALLALVPTPHGAWAQGMQGMQGAQAVAPACYVTGGGALEICRAGDEAEGVFFTPPPCGFARGVQILRLRPSEAPGPIQVVYQGESPPAGERGSSPCESRRALDPDDGGSVRSGLSPEQLATTMPPTEYRLWAETAPAPAPRRRAGRRGRPEPEPTGPEGVIGPRNPIVVAGRDWAGEGYYHVFMLATVGAADQARRVQVQARTDDFTRFEIRTRTADGYGVAWTPFGGAAAEGGHKTGGRARRPSAPPKPTPVLDEAGQPLVSNCTAAEPWTDGLNGSISVVDQTYHYFYTDVLPEDCGEAPHRRRTALYLRTSRDLGAERVWSAPRTIVTPLPTGSFVRVAKAKDMDRWAVSYRCRRPANAPAGPVSDICLQYTADLAIGSIAGLTFYDAPAEAIRSPAYLGLRSGGDGSGRYGRAAHYWMTDRYGNLDTPSTFPGKAGFLTWLDRLAPRADGSETSSLYGRPVYWATWSVRRREPR